MMIFPKGQTTILRTHYDGSKGRTTVSKTEFKAMNRLFIYNYIFIYLFS